MKGSFWNTIRPLLITLLILVILEIFGSTLLPLVGIDKYRVPFNILIVLFMGLRLQTPYIAILILIVQYCHGFFSIEGWEIGTIAGVLIAILIGYFKDLLHFTSAIATILVTQIFQFVWFGVVSALIYFKTGSFTYILEKFWRFLPESIFISLLAPFFFLILDQIWNVEEGNLMGDQH